MTCPDNSFWLDFLLERLPATQKKWAQKHLLDCHPCQKNLQALQLILKTCKQLPPPPPPKNLTSKILQN
ncbi:MAG: hypothetical protein D6805_04480, partial [Planctomycetota bacterium]